MQSQKRPKVRQTSGGPFSVINTRNEDSLLGRLTQSSRDLHFERPLCGLSRSNLPPEVKCPGGKLLRSKPPPPPPPPPDTLLRSKLSAPDTQLRSKVTPLEVDCPPCGGDNLLRSKVSVGQLRSRVSVGQLTSKQSVRGTTYFEAECPWDNLLRSRVSVECPRAN